MDYPNSLLDAMLMEFMGCIISGNYYTNILDIDTRAGTTPEGKLVLFSKDEIKE